MQNDTPALPPRGALAMDTRDNRVGRVMADGNVPGAKGQWWLRPVEGGREWPVPRDSVAEFPPPVEKWIRQCNGQPSEGVLTTRGELRAVLSTSTRITVEVDGRITWMGAGRLFSAEPVRDELAK